MTADQEDFQCWCGWIKYEPGTGPKGYPEDHDEYARTVELQFGEVGVPAHEPSEDYNLPEPEQDEDEDASNLTLGQICDAYNTNSVQYVEGYDKWDDIQAELLAEHMVEIGAVLRDGLALVPGGYVDLDEDKGEDDDALVDS